MQLFNSSREVWFEVVDFYRWFESNLFSSSVSLGNHSDNDIYSGTVNNNLIKLRICTFLRNMIRAAAIVTIFISCWFGTFNAYMSDLSTIETTSTS